MTPAQLVVPLGIVTFICLLVTMATGLAVFRFNVSWVRIQWHVWSAVVTLVLAVAHAALVIFFY